MKFNRAYAGGARLGVLPLAVEDAQAFVAGLAKTHGEELRRFLNPRVRNVADVPDVPN